MMMKLALPPPLYLLYSPFPLGFAYPSKEASSDGGRKDEVVCKKVALPRV